MGVNQSSDCGESSGIRGQGQGRGKTCYYDVLGVPRDATDEEWVINWKLYPPVRRLMIPQNQEILSQESLGASS